MEDAAFQMQDEKICFPVCAHCSLLDKKRSKNTLKTLHPGRLGKHALHVGFLNFGEILSF